MKIYVVDAGTIIKAEVIKETPTAYVIENPKNAIGDLRQHLPNHLLKDDYKILDTKAKALRYLIAKMEDDIHRRKVLNVKAEEEIYKLQLMLYKEKDNG